MTGVAQVRLYAAIPIWKVALARQLAIEVNGRRDTEAQQHTLNSLDALLVRLPQTHADALFDRTLHRAVGVEQASQEAGNKAL